MPQERSEAIIIRAVDFSETSRIVTAITPARGKVAVMAKGVRRKNSPLAAVLDPPARVELVYYWKDGREVQTLGEASLLDGYRGLRRDLAAGAYGAFLVELAGRIAHENEPSHNLYTVLAHALAMLAGGSACTGSVACWATFALLCAAGFEPELDASIRSGVLVGETPGFSFDGGVVTATEPRDVRLGAAAYGDLKQLRAFSAPLESLAPLAVPAEVFRVLTRYAAYQLDCELRSVRVLRELLGE